MPCQGYIYLKRTAMIKKLLFVITGFLLLLSPAAAQEDWGLIRVCCAHLRAKPAHSSEMVTEAILGTPVRILEKENGWYRIQTPDDYESWVHPASVVLKTPGEMRDWRSSARYVYTAFQGFIYEKPQKHSAPVTDVVSGCILNATGRATKGYVPVALPDGRKGYAKKGEVAGLNRWAAQSPDIDRMEAFARRMMGSTYLWGGTSVKGTDCSGFTRIIYFTSGILLMRDASQQAKTGEPVPAGDHKNYRKGDLLFFGKDAGHVDHVGMYLNDGMFIHSSGLVHVSSLDKDSPFYHPANLVCVRRILSRPGTPGITRIKDHPWYIENKL